MVFPWHRRNVPPELAEPRPPGKVLTEKFPGLHFGRVPSYPDCRAGIPRLGRGRPSRSPSSGRSSATCRRRADARHPLRHALVEARHALGGRRPSRTSPRWRSRRRPRGRDLPCRGRLHLERPDRDGDAPRVPAGLVVRRAAPRAGPRLSAARDRARHVLLEEREVAAGHRVQRRGPAGYWERNGYNNDADPWKEERYFEPDSGTSSMPLARAISSATRRPPLRPISRKCSFE